MWEQRTEYVTPLDTFAIEVQSVVDLCRALDNNRLDLDARSKIDALIIKVIDDASDRIDRLRSTG